MNSLIRRPRPADLRPLRKHRRAWAVGTALLAFGLVGCGAGQSDGNAADPATSQPTPTVTVTTTATATATVTAKPEPEPAPTVTETETVTRPGPTVTVTKAAQAVGSGGGSSTSGGSSGGGGSSGKCSIVSNSGNCYQAGQFCRNSDHGASTTTASGSRITCSYSGSAWRWTYS